MQSGTRWRPQPIMGSEVRAVASARPAFPPLPNLDPADWDAIVEARQNLLLHGTSSAIDAVLTAFRPFIREPIHKWRADTEEAIPCFSAGTLILEEVAACPPAQQRLLLQWLGDERQVQVISTTDQPLFDFVRRGAFLVPLYYRLNIVYLDLSFS